MLRLWNQSKISKSNIFSLDICENHCYFFNTVLVLTPCCPLGTKMPRLAQHEACGGSNGGVFFGGPEHITPFAIRSVFLKELPRKNNLFFLGIFQVYPRFLAIFCWGVSQCGLTLARQFGRLDGKPVTLRSNRWELSIVYGSTFVVTFG